MFILGIDTSCDDTSIAILEKTKKIKVLSSVVSSQEKLHAKYGGVWPALAQREHQKNLTIVLKKALKEAGVLVSSRLKGDKISNFQFPISKQIQKSKLKTITKILEREPLLLKNLLKFLSKYQKPKIEAIAVTVGPGLEPCLWQGLNFAKALAFIWNIPIIPVNHLEGHLLSCFLQKTGNNFQFSIFNFQKKVLPAMGLIVSGGHTQLVLIKKIGDYKIIGQTLDDAAGECFDKTARILDLGYPGGPAIAAEAAKFKVQSSKFKVELPRPMISSKNFDFSFSGLKTAVLYAWQNIPKKQKTQQMKAVFAHEIQQSIIDVLLRKTTKATKTFKTKSFLLCGGVSANKELKKQFALALDKKLPFFFPKENYFTDNGAMIALAGLCNFKKKQNFPFKGVLVNGNLNF
ncbi:tRNA (adenosine(37)-N6)-threonylcarbamoyltransferase complex transferase subunit TsaD [Candidatus Parcubacteria bacterium]|nr:tRNA (adenosine(37)-N6)-threonylcarbamoyltransferase complex transferase subunit TsaD [Candidatus Parcubacteria bacterium]